MNTLQDIHNILVYQHHKIPLLPDIRKEKAAGVSLKWLKGLVFHRFRVKFRCPVCGQLAPSGQGEEGEGYELRKPKAWVSSLAGVLSVGLVAAQLAAILTPVVGQTGVAGLLSSAREVLGSTGSGLVSKAVEVAEERSEELLGELEELQAAGGETEELLEKMREVGAKHRPKFTPEQVREVMKLLTVLGDKAEYPEHSGLVDVTCTAPGDESVAWVCREGSCQDKYRRLGRKSLLIDIVLN